MKNRPPIDIERIPERVWDLMNELCDEALSRQYDEKSEDTFVQCLVCGEWEGHTPDCPMDKLLDLVQR